MAWVTTTNYSSVISSLFFVLIVHFLKRKDLHSIIPYQNCSIANKSVFITLSLLYVPLLVPRALQIFDNLPFQLQSPSVSHSHSPCRSSQSFALKFSRNSCRTAPLEAELVNWSGVLIHLVLRNRGEIETTTTNNWWSRFSCLEFSLFSWWVGQF